MDKNKERLKIDPENVRRKEMLAFRDGADEWRQRRTKDFFEIAYGLVNLRKEEKKKKRKKMRLNHETFFEAKQIP